MIFLPRSLVKLRCTRLIQFVLVELNYLKGIDLFMEIVICLAFRLFSTVYENLPKFKLT